MLSCSAFIPQLWFSKFTAYLRFKHTVKKQSATTWCEPPYLEGIAFISNVCFCSNNALYLAGLSWTMFFPFIYF